MVNRDHHEDRATNAIADRMDPTDRGGPTARRFLRGMVTGAEICRPMERSRVVLFFGAVIFSKLLLDIGLSWR